MEELDGIIVMIVFSSSRSHQEATHETDAVSIVATATAVIYASSNLKLDQSLEAARGFHEIKSQESNRNGWGTALG